MRTWLSLIGLVALALGAHLLSERLPAPSPKDAPEQAFSAARAREVLDGLTALGPRVAGMAEARRAAEGLAEALREIPGLEVSVVEAEGVRQFTNTPWPYPIFKYRIINVLARLPGRSTDAVLLDAHFDTTGTSAGAGDDAFGVAAIVEALRALASGPPLERSVIALLNGGEEFGLRGADAFTHHPWAADVRAYLYIDGMARGRPRLVQSTRGHPEMVGAWLEGAPRPSASVVMAEIVEAQTFGADGDHRPLDEAGLVGMSVAALDDMAAAHTRLDGSERVDDASLQAMGEATLGVSRVLASGTTLERPEVYFDAFGWPVSASWRVFTALAALALLAVAAAVRGALKGGLRPGELLGALVGLGLSGGLGLLSAVMLAAGLRFGLGAVQGWYTWMPLAGLGFGAAAWAGLLGAQALWGRRVRPEVRGLAVGAAVSLAWGGVLALGTFAQVGASYLALAFAGPLALAQLATGRWPKRAGVWAALGALPGTALLVHLAVPALRAALPMIVAMPVPADLPASVGVALPALAALSAALPLAHRGGGIGRAAALSGGAALLFAAIMDQRAPFDADHPRHLAATHTERQGAGLIGLWGWDSLPVQADLEGVPGLSPAQAGWRPNLPPMGDPTHELPAALPDLAAPSAEVLVSGPLDGGHRQVSLRLRSESPHLWVLIPAARLAGWSLGTLPEVPAVGERHAILMSGLLPEGEPLELTVLGEEPVEVELRASSPLLNEELRALERALPAHVVLWPEVARSTTLSL